MPIATRVGAGAEPTGEAPPSEAADRVPDPGDVADPDEHLEGSLGPAATTGAAVFAVLALVQAFAVQPPAVFPVVALSGATALGLGLLGWVDLRGELPTHLTRPAITAGLGLGLLNAIALAIVRPYPEATFAFALVAIVAGLLLVSRTWLAGVLAADVVAWAWIAIRSPPAPGWIWWAPVVLVASLALAILASQLLRRLRGSLRHRETELDRYKTRLDEARRRAEDARRTRSRFLANVTNDVRGPVAAIVGRTHDLRAGDVTPDVAEGLTQIEAQARRLVRLFDEMLDLALAETRQLTVREEGFDLDRVVQQSLDTVTGRAREAGLEVGYRLDADVPPVIRTDPHRLKQVLGHLLSNAVTYTEEGRVDLQVGVAQREPLVLRFDVQDTGPGIPEDRQEEIFDPFTRGPHPDDVDGTGLGLALCREVVDLLGGEIDLKSTPGEGSTVAFAIPVEEVEPERAQPEDEPVLLAGRGAWIVGSEGFPAPALRKRGLDVETMPGVGFVEDSLDARAPPSLLVLDLLTIQAPEDFLAERVRSWQERGTPVLVSKPPEQDLPELTDLVGPEHVFTPSVSAKTLHEALISALRGTESVAPTIDAGLGDRHPLSILLVEDSPTNRQLLVSLVSRLGYDPEAVGSGEEALRALDAETFDLVFVDLSLPGIDGDELARRIRADHDTKPRIVALTGHDNPETRQQAEEAGVDAYLTKPVDLADLETQIEATPTAGEG